MENAVLDYMVVGHREVDGTEMLDVLIVAAASAMVEDFYQCFSSLGMVSETLRFPRSVLLIQSVKSLSGNVVLVDISNNQEG